MINHLLAFELFPFLNARFDLSRVVRGVLSADAVSLFDPFLIAPCRCLAIRPVIRLLFVRERVVLVEFAAEVEAFGTMEFLACDFAATSLALLGEFLKAFVSFTDDLAFVDLQAFASEAVEGRLSLSDNLLLRFKCAADFCTRPIFVDDEARLGTPGNVTRDGKRIDADVSLVKSWGPALVELLVIRGTKCRSSACSFLISSRRARMSSMSLLAISDFWCMVIYFVSQLHLEC